VDTHCFVHGFTSTTAASNSRKQMKHTPPLRDPLSPLPTLHTSYPCPPMLRRRHKNSQVIAFWELFPGYPLHLAPGSGKNPDPLTRSPSRGIRCSVECWRSPHSAFHSEVSGTLWRHPWSVLESSATASWAARTASRPAFLLQSYPWVTRKKTYYWQQT